MPGKSPMSPRVSEYELGYLEDARQFNHPLVNNLADDLRDARAEIAELKRLSASHTNPEGSK